MSLYDIEIHRQGVFIMLEKILAAVMFLIAAGVFIMGVRSLKEKGFLFNNRYIYASKQERQNMDKKPYYRQTAVVFFLISLIFLLKGIEILLDAGWLFAVGIVIAVIAATYAIVSSIMIEKNKNR